MEYASKCQYKSIFLRDQREPEKTERAGPEGAQNYQKGEYWIPALDSVIPPNIDPSPLGIYGDHPI